MKRLTIDLIFAGILLLIAFAGPASPQGSDKRTTFTGTALIYGSGMNARTVTRTFTLHLERVTTPEDAKRLVHSFLRLAFALGKLTHTTSIPWRYRILEHSPATNGRQNARHEIAVN